MLLLDNVGDTFCVITQARSLLCQLLSARSSGALAPFAWEHVQYDARSSDAFAPIGLEHVLLVSAGHDGGTRRRRRSSRRIASLEARERA